MGKQLLIVTLALLGIVPAAGASVFSDLDLGVFHDDNIGLSERGRDKQSDAGVDVFGRLGWFHDLQQGTALTASASLRGVQYRSFDDLGEAAAGLVVSLKHKYGLGALAPWGSVGIALDRLDSQSRIRDSWLYSLNLNTGKRLTERWNLSGGVRFDLRNGDFDEARDSRPGAPVTIGYDGDVFDQQSWELRAAADYLLNDRWLLALGYRYRDGDVTSVASPNVNIRDQARAITQDRAFGAYTFAYRLDARTQTFDVTLNYALSDVTSIDFGYEYLASDASGGIDYQRSQLRLRALLSF